MQAASFIDNGALKPVLLAVQHRTISGELGESAN